MRRYAFVRQNDHSDCGAAALATIAWHYKIPVGLESFRELTGTDRAGTNFMGLVRAAERVGLTARGAKGTYEALGRVPLPAVAHVINDEGMGHFVVLFRAGRSAAVVADPAAGVRKWTRAEFCARWTGHLLVAVPGGKPVSPPPGGGPVRPGRRALSLLGAHAPVLAEAFLCALMMTALGVTTSYFLQHLVDSVLVRNEVRLLNALGLGMALVALFRTAFGALRHYLVAHVGRRVDLALVAAYARHLLNLPLSFFETRRVGEILSRVNDAAKVREAVSGTTLAALVDGVLVVLLSAVLWVYDARLAAVASASMPVLLAAVLAHHPAARKRSLEAMERGALLSSHLVEDVCGAETVKAFVAERSRAEQGEVHLVGFVRSKFALQALDISAGSLATFVTTLAGVVVLWYGSHRVMAGALSVGQLLFFYSLLGYLLEPLERLATVNLKVQDALVAMDRLGQVLDVPGEPVGDARRVAFAGLGESLALCDVTFQYGCRGNALDGLNLTIPAGRVVAVVGESGSGKSTLVKLLMGFYTPTGGRYLVDGVDVRDVDPGTLRERIGLVAQDPFVFNATVFANIALGRPGATRAEVIAAARAAGLDDFIATLPDRYDTLIGERGANLSGGQRQRLAIARALVKRPDVLIFDEATSHLDTATERAIQQNLRAAFAGKTVVLVAHRLSTVRQADLIHVLHRGRVAESGTHRELMALGGRYASLWRAQSDGADAPRPAAALAEGLNN